MDFLRGPVVYQSEEEMVDWRAWARQNGWDGVRWNGEWEGEMGRDFLRLGVREGWSWSTSYAGQMRYF